MLNLYTTKRVAEIIDVPEETLLRVAESTSDFVREKTVYDPNRPNRPRDVIAIFGLWRTIQCRLCRRIFSPRLEISPISHGGIPGRDTRKNALAHEGQQFLYVVDISNFFPSISNDRVFRLFRKELGCSPTVARVLTRLCTYDYHLSLGLVTSPILSEQVLIPVDCRLMGLCQKSCNPALIVTRFVDDITISSNFDLKKSFVARIVREILTEHGFSLRKSKERYGRISDGMPITKVRLRGRRTDITLEYARELERLLDDHIALSNGKPFRGPLLSSSAIEGKVLHACRINPGRRQRLRRKLRSIRWDNLWRNAKCLGLVPARKQIVARGSPAPDFSNAYSDGVTTPELVSDHSIATSDDDRCPF